MSEQGYKAIGWGILLLTALLATYWCMNEAGLAGFLLNTSESMTAPVGSNQLASDLCDRVHSGWIIKNYFEGLAWNAHVASLPPRISGICRKSKYVRVEDVPLAPPGR